MSVASSRSISYENVADLVECLRWQNGQKSKICLKQNADASLWSVLELLTKKIKIILFLPIYIPI